MKFDTPATTNPIDRLQVIGRPVDRIDGPLKTTGTAQYAYDRHDVIGNQAYGYVVGSAIPKGRIVAMDLDAAKAAPGVITIVTAREAGKLGKGGAIPLHCWAARRSSTTTRPLPWSWPRRSSRRAQPLTSSKSSTRARKDDSIWLR